MTKRQVTSFCSLDQAATDHIAGDDKENIHATKPAGQQRGESVKYEDSKNCNGTQSFDLSYVVGRPEVARAADCISQLGAPNLFLYGGLSITTSINVAVCAFQNIGSALHGYHSGRCLI